MRKKKISEIMDFIDVNYINEAASYVKLEPSKRPAWKKWGILAACFVVTIIVGVIVLPSVWKSKDSAKELVTIEDLNRPYKEMELEEIILADIMGDGIWPAEYLTLAETCDALTFAEHFYDMHGYTEEKFVGELLGEGECNIYDGVKRGAGNIVGTQRFEVYSLEGISEEIMVVVKIDGEFCLYKNRYYEAATLGEWMEVYQISKNVDLNYCEFSDEDKRQDCFSLTEDDDIWDILEVCKNANRINDYSGIYVNGKKFQFTIDSKKFGKYDRTFTIKEDGYLWTNLFEQREEFFIGEEAAEKIISYVKKYGRKTEMKLRRDYSLSGTITEIADDYILVDDSILCENPEDGMVFKVPTKDLKIRRYVEYLDMQVGDLVWVNFYEGIDVKEGNVVYGVWSIHETFDSVSNSSG